MIADKCDGFYNLEFIESHVVANLKYSYTLHIEYLMHYAYDSCTLKNKF